MNATDENVIYNRASMRSAFNPVKSTVHKPFESESTNSRLKKSESINTSPFNMQKYQSQNLNFSNSIYSPKIFDTAIKTDSGNTISKRADDYVPLRLVPMNEKIALTDSKRLKIVKVSIKNENNYPAGVFGWCFVCRKTADKYCKLMRVPVCSLDCKIEH